MFFVINISDKNQVLLNKYLAAQVPAVPNYYSIQAPPPYDQSYKAPNSYPYLYSNSKNYASPIFGNYYNLPGGPYSPPLNSYLKPNSNYLPTKSPQTENTNQFFPYSSRGYEGK